MSRTKPTWFGIKLSQKHATQVFILSFAGVFILSMSVLSLLTSTIMSLRSAILYGDLDWWIEYTLWYLVPYLSLMTVFLIVTIYSLSSSRKVAKSYTHLKEPQKIESRILKFCPNCGNERTGVEKFCRQCGEELR
jgi:hypothetical protein